MEERIRYTAHEHSILKRKRRRRSSLLLWTSIFCIANGMLGVESFVNTLHAPLKVPTVLSLSDSDEQTFGSKRLQARPNNHRQKQIRSVTSKPKEPRRQGSYKGNNHKHATKRKKTPVSIVKFNKHLTNILSDGQRLSVEEAEKLLLERIETRLSTNTTSTSARNLEYDTFSFNLILSAWAKQRSLVAAKRADMLLQILLETSRQSNVRADAYSYSSVLNSYAKSGGNRRAALRAEELLSQMENTMKIENDICHNCVMECWSVSGDQDAGRRAQVWLTRLEENKSLPNPTRFSYNICLKAWARSNNGALQANQLLDRMNAQSNARLRPDKISYSTGIYAYSRSKTNLTMAADKAEDLLRQMEKSSTIRPDVVAYTSVLSIFAKAGVDTQRAMSLIARMKKHGHAEPNATFLNSLIHLFARKGKPAQCEILLQSMKENGISDKITYTTVMSAHANVGNATRAKELLDELMSMYDKNPLAKYLPTEKTFAAMIHAMAKAKDSSSTSLKEVDTIIENMRKLQRKTNSPELRPSTITYSAIFYLLSRLRDKNTPARAMELLNEMKSQNLSVDSTTYAYIINIFTKARSPKSAEIATRFLDEVDETSKFGSAPSPLFYSAVLQAYAKNSKLVQLEELLLRFKAVYREGKIYAKPTLLCYNAVIDGLARAGRAERAEEVLAELEIGHAAGDDTLRPTVRSYNAAILAWKLSSSTEAPQRAESLLKRMYESGCQPDQVTFNTIIGVYASSRIAGAAERAESFLELLEDMYYNVGEESLKPDSISYNSAINAWANSGRNDAGERAQRIFDRMKAHYEAGDDDLKPNPVTLSSLAKAAQKSGISEAKM